MMQRADDFAERLRNEAPDDASRIERAYELLFSRAPTEEETRLALKFFDVPEEKRELRWSQYAQVLLASNELLYLD
jgi:hypothetical protein